MNNHHFISYSKVDARDFVNKLCDELEAGMPSHVVWLDTRKLRPGEEWDEQIIEAIRTCDSLLFVMTGDSVASQSVCKQEWTRALKYKKPIVPIQYHRDAEMPFRLGSRQCIDFSSNFDLALAELRNHLRWLASPQGNLHSMKNQLADYRHDASRTDDPGEQKRIENEIKRLEKEIKDQQRIVDDPEEADQLKDKLTKGEPPPSVVESTIVVQDNSQLISDLIGPSYVLDNNYYFLDWNQAFDGRALGSDATILTICSTGRSLSVVFAQLSRICPGS